ncbi:MAG: DUF898 family protein [Pseudomonadota bacterium]
MLPKPSVRYEPISELFGDVVQDKPSEFYLSEEERQAEIRAAQTASTAVEPDEAAPPAGFDFEIDQPVSAAPPLAPPPGPPPATSSPPPSGPSETLAIGYQDDRGLLSSVVVTHGLLSVLSLGLWRFWMKTHTRSVLWSHTKIGDEPLEWTGKGSELLIGFLIAAVFLGGTLAAANLSIAFLGIGAAPELATGAAVQAGLVAAVALLPLRQYAAFRVRRYRLSRTRWRGIRFAMDGSGLSMVGLWLLWTPAVILTAGFAFPLWRWARERQMARRMRWGEERFALDGNAFRLLPAFLPLYAALAAIAGAAISENVRAALGPFNPEVVMEAGLIAIIAMGATLVFALWALWMSYRAAEIRLVLGGLSLRGARLRSELTSMHLIDAYFLVMRKNLWPGIGVYIFVGIVTAIPMVSAMGAEMSSLGSGGLFGSEGLEAQLFEGFTTWRAQGLVLMAMILNYVLYSVFQLWLWVGVYGRRVHEHVCNTLVLEGAEHLEAVRQGVRDTGVEAEGFADALDMGAAA